MSEKEYTPEGHLKINHDYKATAFDNFTGSVIDRNGVIVYYKDGEIHRDDGDKPAIINTKNYRYVVKRGWMKNGKPHRLNGLAYEDNDSSWQCYAYNGNQFLKEERDEWIKACGHTKVQYLADKRNDKSFTGSAINSNDDVLFLKEGVIHREDGPAMLYKSQIAYVKNGRYHRLDGPAIIKPDGAEVYFIEDKHYSTKEEWEVARDKYVRIEKILKHYGLDKVVKVQDVVEVQEQNSKPSDNFTGVTICTNDFVAFWKNGKPHRDNDEFCFYNDFNSTYPQRTKRVNGQLHSTTGPAWIDKKGDEYFLDGVGFGSNKIAWEEEISKEKIRKILDGNGLENISEHDLRVVAAKNWADPLKVNVKFTGIVVDTTNEIVVFFENGRQHRDDGPAFLNLVQDDVNTYDRLAYVVNGKLHRLDGPAVVNQGYETYWIDNELFSSKEDFDKKVQELKTREILDKYGLQEIKVEDVTLVDDWRHIPTGFTGIVLDKNNMVVFYKEGRKHRENGPCFFNDNPKEIRFIQRAWRLNGKLHRTDGPAWVEDFDKPELDRYYLDNKNLSKEEWEKAVQALNKEKDKPTSMTTTAYETTPEGHRKVKSYNKFEGKSTFTGSVIDENGLVCYYKDGKEHREDGPSFINTENKLGWIKEYWCRNGKLHRLDGPARVELNTDDHSYYIEGAFYTKEAWETKIKEMGLKVSNNEVKKTYKDTKIGDITPEGHLKVKHWLDKGGHSFFTGSVIDSNGFVCYYVNGKEHREDGPSYINTENLESHIKECWVQNGLIHREDGPAWIEANGTERYVLKGTFYRDKEAWEKDLKELGRGKFKRTNNKHNELKPISIEAQEAAYRVARNELLKLVQGMLVTQLGGKASAETFLSSELGTSIVFGAVGVLLPKLEDKLPVRFRPHLERLNKEFRVSAMASFGNNAAEMLKDSLFVTKTTNILQSIPTTVESTTVKEMVVTVSVSQKS